MSRWERKKRRIEDKNAAPEEMEELQSIWRNKMEWAEPAARVVIDEVRPTTKARASAPFCRKYCLPPLEHPEFLCHEVYGTKERLSGTGRTSGS